MQREPLNHKKKGQGEGEMDIIGLGKPVKDFLITLQKMPPEDQGTWLDDYSSQCGGKEATAIVAPPVWECKRLCVVLWEAMEKAMRL